MTEHTRTTAPTSSSLDASTPPAAQKNHKGRSVAIAVCLVAFVVLVFVLTLVRLKEQALVQY